MLSRIFPFLVLAVCLSGPASAATIFTDLTSFNAAISGLGPSVTNTLDFDSLAAGSIVSSGDTVAGFTFNYNFATGDSLRVSTTAEAGQGTTSGSQFLGTDYAGNFNLIEDAEGMQLVLPGPTTALGLFVTSLDTVFDGDFVLTTSEGFVSNVAADGVLLADGFTTGYFLGIVSDNPFTSAQLSNCGSPTGCAGGPFFLYGVDDITAVSAVPEPNTMILLGSALVGLGAWRRRVRGSTAEDSRGGNRPA